MVISDKIYLGYDDVFIIPQYSDVETRQQVSTKTILKGVHSKLDISLEVPVISANMDTITEDEMATCLSKQGAQGALHRFLTKEENVKQYRLVQEAGQDCFVSIGVSQEDRERALLLFYAGARRFIIDIAHGHSLKMKETITWLRTNFGKEVFIVAGNVATNEAAFALECWGADAVKVGIGPGCFAAGTRILMSNGQYKNIEEIIPGEFVINKNGKPVEVLNAFSTGIRKVVKLRTNHFYKSTFVTPDHKYWIGDLSSTNTFTGYSSVLDKKSKTVSKTSKYKWHKIGDNGNFVSLLPKNIEFNLPKTFSIDLKKRVGGNYHSGHKYENFITLKPSYELGYIFGTFLGDGSVKTPKAQVKESNTVTWAFGKNENSIATKLACCLDSIFHKQPTVKQPKNKNILLVSFYSKPFADFLSCFNKREKKHLPDELLVDDKKYLEGLYQGLVDSDGCVSDNRTSIHNTSIKIIELYNVLNFILNEHFPLNEMRKPSVGGLKNTKIENCKISYVARNLKNHKARLTKDYQVVKILEIEPQEIEVPVYDLEVDCETHSFIADNSIVHNSVCTTKDVTGVTVPMFGCLEDCLVPTSGSINIIADGGARSYGDIAKAIGLGAKAVMSGYFFAGCNEVPDRAKLFDYTGSGNQSFIYRGMASSEAMKVLKKDKLPTPEGKLVEVSGKGSAEHVIKDIAGGLRSSMSYSNANNTTEFVANVKFGRKR
jgi:IMP dehydrogenase/GMP reductase/intein/homing endonuclease